MRVASPKKMGLPARAFVTLLRLAPSGIQNRMWKWWYQKMAKANDDRQFRFMNYGFEDGNGPELEDEDEANRMFIQLYSMNIRGIDLEGREVLEVGGDADLVAVVHVDDTVALRGLLDEMWLAAPGEISSTQTELVLEQY